MNFLKKLFGLKSALAKDAPAHSMNTDQTTEASKRKLPTADAETLYQRGLQLATQENFRQAIPILEEAAALNPLSAPIHQVLGFSYSQFAGEYVTDKAAMNSWVTKAADTFRKAVTLHRERGGLEPPQLKRAIEFVAAVDRINAANSNTPPHAPAPSQTVTPPPPTPPKSSNAALIAKVLDWRTGAEGRVSAMQQLYNAGDPQLIETLIKIEVVTFGHKAVFDAVVSLSERMGVSALLALTKHLHNHKWTTSVEYNSPNAELWLARDEKCARALARIGKPECEAALELALREADERKKVNPAGVFTEHLVNALESFRNPESASKREKREVENNKLILVIQDQYHKPKDERITAIRKLVTSEDSRMIRVLARVFDNQDYEGHVEDAALAELERIGLEAIPALAYALHSGDGGVRPKAAMALARLGDATCEAILEARLSQNESHDRGGKFLVDALQSMRDPAAAKAREEHEQAERAIYGRIVKTQNTEEAVSAVFRDMLSLVPVLTEQQIDGYFRDWGGNADVSLQQASAATCESTVQAHLSELRRHAGFESFRVQIEPRWKCVLVNTFYGGVCNLLLVWRKQDSCVVTHT